MPVGDGLERRGSRRLDRDGPGLDRGRDRRATPGASRAPVPGGGAGQRHAPPAPDVHDRWGRAQTEPRGRPSRHPQRGTGRSARPIPVPPPDAVSTRDRGAPGGRGHAAGDRLRFQPGGMRPSRSAMPRGGPAPDRLPRACAAPRDRRRADGHLGCSRSRSAAIRRMARRARGRVRRPPCRHGAADEGSGRGGVHARAREGRVRDRDPGARHQHAGPISGDREALEVHG